MAGHILEHPGGQFNAFGFGTLGQQLDGAFDHVAEVEIDDFDAELARLDFGKVQDVVDDRQ